MLASVSESGLQNQLQIYLKNLKSHGLGSTVFFSQTPSVYRRTRSHLPSFSCLPRGNPSELTQRSKGSFPECMLLLWSLSGPERF